MARSQRELMLSALQKDFEARVLGSDVVQALLCDSDWSWRWEDRTSMLACCVVEDYGPRARRVLEVFFQKGGPLSYLIDEAALMVRCPADVEKFERYLVSIVTSFLLDPEDFSKHMVLANAETDPV